MRKMKKLRKNVSKKKEEKRSKKRENFQKKKNYKNPRFEKKKEKIEKIILIKWEKNREKKRNWIAELRKIFNSGQTHASKFHTKSQMTRLRAIQKKWADPLPLLWRVNGPLPVLWKVSGTLPVLWKGSVPVAQMRNFKWEKWENMRKHEKTWENVRKR